MLEDLPLQLAFKVGHVPALPCVCLSPLHMGNHFMDVSQNVESDLEPSVTAG